MLRPCLLAVTLFAGSSCGLHSSESPSPPEDKKKDDATIIAEQLPSYPLSECVISGKALGFMGKPVNHVHEGRLVRFCCEGCRTAFNEKPDVYLAKIDEATNARFFSLLTDHSHKDTSKKDTSQKAGCGGCGAKAGAGCGCGTAAKPAPEATGGCGGCGSKAGAGCGTAAKPAPEATGGGR